MYRSYAPLLARWNAMPNGARLFLAVAAFVLLTGGAVTIALVHPARSPLFAAPLHPEQLAEVQERFAEWNVSFTPTNDNVAVDTGRRNELLLRLSLAGVPHAHIAGTSEALASIGALTPEAVIEAQTRAGLAGDIEAGLRGIDGVEDARVIVAPDKPAEFAAESSHDASASVRLRMHPGAALSHEAIAGIRAFVAASVPELAPARVTILDDRGTALGDGAAPTDDAADLQRSLQSALDAAFGSAAAIVRVRAEYEEAGSSEHDVRRVVVAPDPIVRMRRSESYDASGKRYRQLEESEDRGTETHESVAQTPAGALKRLSAAVFVDQSRALDLAKVHELAGATLGYDAQRGDTLVVEAVAFHEDLSPRNGAWWLIYGEVVPLLPAVLIALALVGCARFVLPPTIALARSMAERAALERATKDAAGFPPSRVRSILEQEPPHAAAAIISALPAATATAVLELYPPHEREAIVQRMQRRHTSLLADPQELLRRRV
jgi:flagellar biosynthesis/type III secretory pathway M-ring protein FliF/YscJ